MISKYEKIQYTFGDTLELYYYEYRFVSFEL